MNDFNIEANNHQVNNEMNTHYNKEKLKDLLISHKITNQLQLLEEHYNTKIIQMKELMYDFYSHTQTIDKIKCEYIIPNKKHPFPTHAASSNNKRSTSVDHSFRLTAKSSFNPQKRTKQNFYLPKVTIDIESPPNKTRFFRSSSRRSTDKIIKHQGSSPQFKYEPLKSKNSSKAFKFEPKKRNYSFSQLYNNSNLNVHSSDLNVIKIEHLSPKLSDTFKSFDLFSLSKYQKIHQHIMAYIGKSKNSLKNTSPILRRAFLLNEITTLNNKLSHSEEACKGNDSLITQAMEKEVILHNLKVLNNYLTQYN